MTGIMGLSRCLSHVQSFPEPEFLSSHLRNNIVFRAAADFLSPFRFTECRSHSGVYSVRRCINLYFVASARLRYSGTSGNGCYMSQACQLRHVSTVHVSPFHLWGGSGATALSRSRRPTDLATLTFSEFSQKWYS